MWLAGRGLWGVCGVCHRVIKMNKLILGSLHFCLSDEEIAQEKSDLECTENQAERNIRLGLTKEPE